MKQISPRIGTCFWFDNQAEAAVEFYQSVFTDVRVGSKVLHTESSAQLANQSPGTVVTLDFSIANWSFTALNGGPGVQMNPSISHIVSCENKTEVHERWERLAEGGTPLMPLGSYPFSDQYGWVQDKYGVSWQLILPRDKRAAKRPKVVPSLMFVGDIYTKADEAMTFYTSVFEDTVLGDVYRYGPGHEPDVPNAIMYADFMVAEQWFAVMDSGLAHQFSFNEGTSFVIYCDTQQEIDYYWERLSAAPKVEHSGWLRDTYGVSWQVVPRQLSEWLANPNNKKVEAVMRSLQTMRKIDIGQLEQAYRAS